MPERHGDDDRSAPRGVEDTLDPHARESGEEADPYVLGPGDANVDAPGVPDEQPSPTDNSESDATRWMRCPTCEVKREFVFEGSTEEGEGYQESPGGWESGPESESHIWVCRECGTPMLGPPHDKDAAGDASSVSVDQTAKEHAAFQAAEEERASGGDESEESSPSS